MDKEGGFVNTGSSDVALDVGDLLEILVVTGSVVSQEIWEGVMLISGNFGEFLKVSG
jgi:hypothetical protein